MTAMSDTGFLLISALQGTEMKEEALRGSTLPFSKKVLLMPAMPTPNGRLHLGHVAGPFMRMDVLNRFIRSRGGQSLLSTGVDAYESHVLLSAFRENSTPEEIANRYAGMIEEDLRAVAIDCDVFINPLAADYSKQFRDWNMTAVELISNSGFVRVRKEQVPRGLKSGRYITGCWIAGRCPECKAEASGYCCSNCGYHFRPEELVGARSRTGPETLDWVEMNCLHLEIDDPERLLKVRPPYPDAVRKARNYLDRQERLVRLSAPGDWGVPIQVDNEVDVSQVVFTYTAIGFQLLAADAYRMLGAGDYNGFDPDSDVAVVGGFGSDNVIPFLVGMQGGLVAAGFKPFDHFLINDMMSLEGELFTTSGNHAIWVSDLIHRSCVEPDMVRYYLAKVSPEDGRTDFSVEEFIQATEELSARWSGVRQMVKDMLQTEASARPPQFLITCLEEALIMQNQCLNLDEGVRMQDLPGIVDEWIELMGAHAAGETAYWWVKGLALLAFPLMPRWAQAQWEALGHDGSPRTNAFFKTTRPNTVPTIEYSPVTWDQVLPSLPEGIPMQRLSGAVPAGG